tara:strand:- start:735 stop:932 length:198 start_codon:yes stop_codon:yes gene_type:complete
MSNYLDKPHKPHGAIPMGQLTDLMRDTLAEMKRQDDELQEKLDKVVKTADKLVKETDKLLEIIEE